MYVSVRESVCMYKCETERACLEEGGQEDKLDGDNNNNNSKTFDFLSNFRYLNTPTLLPLGHLEAPKFKRGHGTP